MVCDVIVFVCFYVEVFGLEECCVVKCFFGELILCGNGLFNIEVLLIWLNVFD